MKLRTLGKWVTLLASVMLLAGTMLAQETTGGLIGTVKDPTGAVVPGAKVVVTAPSLWAIKHSPQIRRKLPFARTFHLIPIQSR